MHFSLAHYLLFVPNKTIHWENGLNHPMGNHAVRLHET
jgi:hypothetical protein